MNRLSLSERIEVKATEAVVSISPVPEVNEAGNPHSEALCDSVGGYAMYYLTNFDVADCAK